MAKAANTDPDAIVPIVIMVVRISISCLGIFTAAGIFASEVYECGGSNKIYVLVGSYKLTGIFYMCGITTFKVAKSVPHFQILFFLCDR